MIPRSAIPTGARSKISTDNSTAMSVDRARARRTATARRTPAIAGRRRRWPRRHRRHHLDDQRQRHTDETGSSRAAPPPPPPRTRARRQRARARAQQMRAAPEDRQRRHHAAPAWMTPPAPSKTGIAATAVPTAARKTNGSGKAHASSTMPPVRWNSCARSAPAGSQQLPHEKRRPRVKKARSARRRRCP